MVEKNRPIMSVKYCLPVPATSTSWILAADRSWGAVPRMTTSDLSALSRYAGTAIEQRLSSWRAFWEPVQHQWRWWQRAAACHQRTDDMRRHETRWALRPASRTLWRAVVRALTLGNTRCAPTHGKEIIRPNRRKCIRSRFCTLQI